ncbi:MAG: glycosyltransferase family 9 protein [Caulobacteraceae bacterium]|nr:glycosyltransferase family 9 protein [Caulobacteraceae bacterium]
MARATNIAKVLVIARGPLERFVLALAAMRRIREAHPQAQIHLLTSPPFEALAQACPYVDRVDADGQPEDLGDWAELVGRLRGAKFDRVYDLEGSAWTGRLFLLLRPFPPAWSGSAFGCALPHRNPQRRAMHPLERHADQLKAAGIWPDAPTSPGAAPPPDASWIGRRALAPRVQPRLHVLLAPGAAAAPEAARWPVRAYGELAQRLRAQGYDVIVLGGPAESVLAQAIQHRAQARDLTGRTDFAQVAALAARAALAVGNDTGLMHLVAAAGAPTLALLPRTADPHRAAPRGHVAVLHAEDLHRLGVDEVLRAAERLIPPIQKTM